MSKITVERQVSPERLQELGVKNWPTWSAQASEFAWTYDESETAYLLEGQVIVTPEGGAPVEFGAGDLVTFASGLRCGWKILKAVRKHYNFG